MYLSPDFVYGKHRLICHAINYGNLTYYMDVFRMYFLMKHVYLSLPVEWPLLMLSSILNVPSSETVQVLGLLTDVF